MGEAKRKRLAGGAIARVQLGARVKRGAFPLGGGKFVRLELPADLTKQGKYDAATSLAKACQELIAEADAMPDDGCGL